MYLVQSSLCRSYETGIRGNPSEETNGPGRSKFYFDKDQ